MFDEEAHKLVVKSASEFDNEGRRIDTAAVASESTFSAIDLREDSEAVLEVSDLPIKLLSQQKYYGGIKGCLDI
jgi:hypothetical protein